MFVGRIYSALYAHQTKKELKGNQVDLLFFGFLTAFFGGGDLDSGAGARIPKIFPSGSWQ